MYVDDIIVTSASNAAIEDIISSLCKEFAIKDLGDLQFFLGIHVERPLEGMFLSQQQYVVNLLHDEGLNNLKPASTPMESRVDLTLSTMARLNQMETTKFRRILGSLQYLTTMRPDIAFAVSKLSQFFSTSTKCHWKALQRMLRYVSGNPFADRRSQGGFIVSYSRNLVSWQ